MASPKRSTKSIPEPPSSAPPPEEPSSQPPPPVEDEPKPVVNPESKPPPPVEDEPKPVVVNPKPKPTPTPKPTPDKGDKSNDECPSPTPSGTDISVQDVEKIVLQSIDLLALCQKKVDQQKIDSNSLNFMLLRIKGGLDAYFNDYIIKLNSFSVHAERITADYYAKMLCHLPKYGDFVKVIEKEQKESINAGGKGPVSKEELLCLVRGVTDNYYASAMFIKLVRNILKDVNTHMDDRKDLLLKISTPMDSWLEIQGNIICLLERTREETFQIQSYLDFLKQGEFKISPTLDLSALDDLPRGC